MTLNNISIHEITVKQMVSQEQILLTYHLFNIYALTSGCVLHLKEHKLGSIIDHMMMDYLQTAYYVL